MAAHLLTALRQIRGEIERDKNVYWPSLQAALELSCWTEDLDLDDYRSLATIVHNQDLPALKIWVDKQTAVATQTWRKLNQPVNREQWVDRLYRQVVLGEGG
jgi:hypothetical protein